MYDIINTIKEQLNIQGGNVDVYTDFCNSHCCSYLRAHHRRTHQHQWKQNKIKEGINVYDKIELFVNTKYLTNSKVVQMLL